MINPSDIAARREALLAEITTLAADAGRSPQSIKLVAVSKRQPEERLAEALVRCSPTRRPRLWPCLT